MLTDMLKGNTHPWSELFSPSRIDILPSVKKLVTENTNVLKHYVGDRLQALNSPEIEQLASGEAALVKNNGERVAAYRDESGEVHVCSAICPHMGCYVQWNTAELSWDCPCHGSRFDYTGKLLQGPAVDGLNYSSIKHK